MFFISHLHSYISRSAFYIAAFSCLFIVALETPALASNDPIAIIHFKAKTDDYIPSFINIVKQAQAIKPAVFFDIVTLLPEKMQDSPDANNQSDRIKYLIQQQGIAIDRIRVSIQYSPLVSYEEVHVFAR
jgi:hypothetical protein